MEKLSVTIITFNEEQNIQKALESVKWADEIVIVDSFSTDNTIEICKKFTTKIFKNAWSGHIAQKNYAIDKTTNNWILSIDADEQVTTGLEKAICKEMLNPSFDAYSVPRRVYYINRWISHSGWYPDHKIRIFNKNNCRWGGINPHDKILVTGKTKKLKDDLLHFSFKNIADHINTMNNFTSIASNEYYEIKKPVRLTDILLRPFFMFLKSYFLKQGIRDGMAGLIISIISAHHVFIKYVKLWEVYNTRKNER